MKNRELYAETIAQAKYVLDTFEVDFQRVGYFPPTKGSRGWWTLTWFSPAQNDYTRIVMRLFPTVIKIMLNKYEKQASKLFFRIYQVSRDKRVLNYLWNNISEETKQYLSAQLLGISQ